MDRRCGRELREGRGHSAAPPSPLLSRHDPWNAPSEKSGQVSRVKMGPSNLSTMVPAEMGMPASTQRPLTGSACTRRRWTSASTCSGRCASGGSALSESELVCTEHVLDGPSMVFDDARAE